MSDDGLIHVDFHYDSGGAISAYDQQKATALEFLRGHDTSFILLQKADDGVHAILSFRDDEDIERELDGLLAAMLTLAVRAPKIFYAHLFSEEMDTPD